MRLCILFALLLVAPPASADEASMTATMQCDRAVEPGRVRCTVEARAAAGRTLQWADVVLVDTPPFAQALKGRLAPADEIARDASSKRWAFGLVAKKAGDGDITAKVRAVVCEATRCAPVVVTVAAAVHVG